MRLDLEGYEHAIAYAWDDGFHAYHDGLGRTDDCPYPDLRRRDAWAQGWDAAATAVLEAKQKEPAS